MNDLSRLNPTHNGEKRLAPHGVLLTSELTNDELIALDKLYDDALIKREEAKKHEKFKKMQLPPVNPLFTMKHNEVKEEIKKRKLDLPSNSNKEI